MAQSRKVTIDQLLKLLDQLSEEVSQMEEFRQEVQKGIDAADRGELKPAEEVLERLRKRVQSKNR